VKSLQEALFHCKGVAQTFLLSRAVVGFFVGEHIDVFFDTQIGLVLIFEMKGVLRVTMI